MEASTGTEFSCRMRTIKSINFSLSKTSVLFKLPDCVIMKNLCTLDVINK